MFASSYNATLNQLSAFDIYVYIYLFGCKPARKNGVQSRV